MAFLIMSYGAYRQLAGKMVAWFWMVILISNGSYIQFVFEMMTWFWMVFLMISHGGYRQLVSILVAWYWMVILISNGAYKQLLGKMVAWFLIMVSLIIFHGAYRHYRICQTFISQPTLDNLNDQRVCTEYHGNYELHYDSKLIKIIIKETDHATSCKLRNNFSGIAFFKVKLLEVTHDHIHITSCC